jgi:hypothetical protein
MILASGKYTFSCNPAGVFSLTGFHGIRMARLNARSMQMAFFMKVDVLQDYIDEAVVTIRSGLCPTCNTPDDPDL